MQPLNMKAVNLSIYCMNNRLANGVTALYNVKINDNK